VLKRGFAPLYKIFPLSLRRRGSALKGEAQRGIKGVSPVRFPNGVRLVDNLHGCLTLCYVCYNPDI